MDIYSEVIDTFKGTPVYLISMRTGNGLEAVFTTMGAAIQKIALTDENGKETVVTLSFADIASYEKGIGCAGMTIGPNAGRVECDTIKIGEQPLSLIPNEGSYSLHGGAHGLSSLNWSVSEIRKDHESCSLTMSASLEHGIDGWPGNRRFYVHYILEDTGWLTVTYTASTDRTTYINMTNHTYWNMTGEPDQSLRQILTIPAEQVCENNQLHLPVRLRSVVRSSFDARKGQKLSDLIHIHHSNITVPLSSSDESSSTDSVSTEDMRQLSISHGLNHGYVLSRSSYYHTLRNLHLNLQLNRACTLSDPITGHTLKMMTDAPALVVYSAGFMKKGIVLENSKLSCPSCAVALEAQELPTVIPYTLTAPGKDYVRNIRFHIS